MAHVTDIRMSGTTVFNRIAQQAETLMARYAKYRAYRATINELSALSTHELDDLGLSRSGLKRAAYEATYK